MPATLEQPRQSNDPPGASRQQTLAREAVVRGIGYVTGADVTVRMLPAKADAGIHFVRVDLPDRPQIPALAQFALDRKRRTALGIGSTVVEMVEHILSALSGLGVDNCIIEIDAGELPGLDGSARGFVEAIDAAGLVELDALRRPLVVTDSVCVSEGDAVIALQPGPTDRLAVTYNLDYPHPGVGKQNHREEISIESYRKEISSARTFILEEEVAALQAQGIGARSSVSDLLVFDANGQPIDNRLRFPDECARHKILDVVGDLALFGRPIHGQIFAHKSGHQLNLALVRKLAGSVNRWTERELLSRKPYMDSIEIERLLPHRYPFLLVDRVLDLEPNRRAVGIKNVTYNEPFFEGHWPGRPVMPGVLIVEAMAQLAGLMLASWRREGHYIVISSMNDIKFRRPVTPGDQLWLEGESVRLKSRTVTMRVRAKVQRQLAAEAKLNFVMVPGNAEV